MDDQLQEKLTILANECGDPEVKTWIGKHMAKEIRGSRARRKRGVRVRLARINREIVLDADVLARAEKAEESVWIGREIEIQRLNANKSQDY